MKQLICILRSKLDPKNGLKKRLVHSLFEKRYIHAVWICWIFKKNDKREASSLLLKACTSLISLADSKEKELGIKNYLGSEMENFRQKTAGTRSNLAPALRWLSLVTFLWEVFFPLKDRIHGGPCGNTNSFDKWLVCGVQWGRERKINSTERRERGTKLRRFPCLFAWPQQFTSHTAEHLDKVWKDGSINHEYRRVLIPEFNNSWIYFGLLVFWPELLTGCSPSGLAGIPTTGLVQRLIYSSIHANLMSTGNTLPF